MGLIPQIYYYYTFAIYQNGTMTIADKTGVETLTGGQVQARVEAEGFAVPAM